MKTIQNLIPDIYSLVKRKDGWFTDAIARELSDNTSKRLQTQFNEEKRIPTLRLSAMGPACPKALWHRIHTPELAEPLPPWAEIKYSYGHILEGLAISLAKAAGHEVTGEQDELVLDGIKGHRDCVIDGCVVDVKSASSRSFQKFKDRSLAQDDAFGYLDQLDGYVVASRNDALVREKDRGYLLAIDKSLGHMVLYEHTSREESIKRRIRTYKHIVALSEAPACTCNTDTDGKNVWLKYPSTYSAFKYCCYSNIRTCLYAGKEPRYFTHVEKWPTYAGKPLPEINRDGKIIHHH